LSAKPVSAWMCHMSSSPRPTRSARRSADGGWRIGRAYGRGVAYGRCVGGSKGAKAPLVETGSGSEIPQEGDQSGEEMGCGIGLKRISKERE